MLVLSMTNTEIYREIMRDFETISRRSTVEGKIFHNEMLRKKLQAQTRSACYRTPSRNDWNIIFQMDSRGTKTSYYLTGNDGKGMVAYLIQFLHGGTVNEDKFVVKYSGHFFHRYNERMGLGFKETPKVIKYFFRNNVDYDLGTTEILHNGIRSTHFIFEKGIGIGWQNDAEKTLHMKTFISNDTLTTKQRSLAEHIKYKKGEGKFYQAFKLGHLLNAF